MLPDDLQLILCREKRYALSLFLSGHLAAASVCFHFIEILHKKTWPHGVLVTLQMILRFLSYIAFSHGNTEMSSFLIGCLVTVVMWICHKGT